MKQGIKIGLMGVMAMSVQFIYGAENILQNHELVIPLDETSFTVELNLEEDKSYAGAEFGIDLSEGVVIKKIDYGIDQDYMSVGPVMNNKGDYYFGFFDGENKYLGDYTITMTLEKSDETIKEASVSLKALNITRLDEDKNVQTDRQSLNEVLTVQFGMPQEVGIPEIEEEAIMPEDNGEKEQEQVAKEPAKVEKESIIKKEIEQEVESVVEPEIIQEPEESGKVEEPVKEIIVPEKEIVEVEVEKPIPYGKISFVTLVVAVLAFFVGRFTKKGVPKEDQHEHTL